MSEPAIGRCGFWRGHDWSKWEKKYSTYFPVLSGGAIDKTTTCIQEYQERLCLKCGIIERKDLL